MSRRIEVLDTTLRDGAQGEGVSFSTEDKIKIITALDQMQIDYIEAGNPSASARDAELFACHAARPLTRHAQLVAFGSTARAHTAASEDGGLKALIDANTPVVSIFGKSWAFHVDAVLGVDRAENLSMIGDSVRFAVECGRRVFFDAEHFFDGYAEDAEYALSTLRAAKAAGAARVVLCDTNGGALPGDIARATCDVIRALRMPVAIHCHNDAGLATACTLAAVEAGACQVQGTINGYGERCGNADLCQIIPNLMLKMGLPCLPEGALSSLTSTSIYISGIANMAPNAHAPYVGMSAFAHKGGMHIDGMLKNRRTFEHMDPALVGNRRRYLISEMAGRGALLTRLNAFAPDLTKESAETAALIQMLKSLEADGYTFEDADASFVLRALGALGRRRRFFEVLNFNVFSEKPESENNAQAYVKVRVDGCDEITADEGDGPVNALDKALRKALARFYPAVGQMRLVDFKVRVVGGSGTASRVRVHIESANEAAAWATVGVSNNVIEASFIALTDSIEYMLMRAAHE